MSVCGYIRLYLAVVSPENKGSFGLEEKMKSVCALGKTNYSGLRNVRPPIIDPHLQTYAKTTSSPHALTAKDEGTPQKRLLLFKFENKKVYVRVCALLTLTRFSLGGGMGSTCPAFKETQPNLYFDGSMIW